MVCLWLCLSSSVLSLYLKAALDLQVFFHGGEAVEFFSEHK